MIIQIKEIDCPNRNYYEKTITENNKKITTKVNLRSVAKNFSDGIRYVLFDSKHNIIESAYKYVNFGCNANNSKIAAINAMRLFFSYLELTNTKPEDMKTKMDVKNLTAFLKGISLSGKNTVDLTTKRTNSSVNIHLNFIMQFYRYFEIYDVAILNTKTVQIYNELGSIWKVQSSTVKLREVEDLEVPHYVSAEEFVRILEVIKKDYTLREEIMVRLMFQMGFRIGENLSLTIDDIGYSTKNKQKTYKILFRNRVSGSKHQKCKNLMTVNRVEDYKDSMYSVKNYGYTELPIANGLYDLIERYIDTIHMKCRTKHPATYELSIADIVNPRFGNPDPQNRYLMLGNKGAPLGYEFWRNIIKEIYIKAEIEIDKGSKKHNLNHRLRHGFAMYHVLVKNVTPMILQKYLRQRNPKSCMIYFRPTNEDIAAIKEMFEDKLFNNYKVEMFDNEGI